MVLSGINIHSLLTRSVITALMCWSASLPVQAESPTAAALIGQWENLTNGDRLGLELKDDQTCEVYTERALKPRSQRACKYEPFENRYLVFLFNDAGVCSSAADFEFIFEPDAPLLRLMISGSEIPLAKLP